MKRVIAILLASVVCIFAFAACASQESTKNVEVFIINQIDDETLSDTLSLPDASAAGEYFRQLCNKNDFEIVGIDEGYVTRVEGLENNDTNAWMFYVNGELCDVGVKDYVPADGDKIELIYLDWTQISFE